MSKKRTPAKVLLISAEDSPEDTLRPRLEDMGADLSLVHFMTSVQLQEGKEVYLNLEKHLKAIDKELSKGGYKLVVIDPINAYLGGVDTHKDSDVRSTLAPVIQVAEKHNVALVCIRHLCKASGGKAMLRGQGSVAYTAAARVVFIVEEHPENEDKRVIACCKNNLARKPKAQMFAVQEGRFAWLGETDITAEELAGIHQDHRKRAAVDDATEFLQELLADGAMSKKDIEIASEGADISDRTLKRAKKKLQVQSRRVGGKEGHWVWELSNNVKGAKSTVEQTVASLEGEIDDFADAEAVNPNNANDEDL